MAMRVAPKGAKRSVQAAQVQGKRFYFEAQNGIRVSVRGRNGLIAAKALPSWVLL